MEPAATSLPSALPAAEPIEHHLLLEYRPTGADSGGMPPVWWSVMMLAAWSLAAATLFLPFTWGVAPWDLVHEFAAALWALRMEEGMFLVLLVVPFVFALPAAGWHLRLIVSWRRAPGRGERMVVLVLGSLTAAAPMAFVAIGASYGDFAGTVEEWLILSTPFLCVAIGVLAAVVIHRRSSRPVDLVLGVLPIGYVANAAMLLFAFRDDKGLGWTLTLIASGVFTLGVMRLALLAPRARD